MFDAELCDAVPQRVATAGLQDDVIVVGHVVPFVATTHFAAASCLGLAFSSCALILLGLVLAGLSSGTDSCSVLAMGDSRLLGAVNECVARRVP